MKSMQPPRLNAYMRDQLERLRSDAARAQEAVEATQRTKLDYVVLIRDWFNQIPPAGRQRRYTTHELLMLFAGRYRSRPALRLISQALMANGFTPKRDWTVAGRNQRYWLPPCD